MADAIRQIGVSEVTYYRWRQEFGGLKTEQVKRGPSQLHVSERRACAALGQHRLDRDTAMFADATGASFGALPGSSMQARRRAGLRSFPGRPPTE